MNPNRIGLQIKYHRQATGQTQKDLAEKIGTTWEMVSRYETGKSSPLRKLPQIAEALGVDMATLLTEQTITDMPLTYSRNTIPFIDKVFTDLHKALDATKNFYVAPDWIVQTCLRPFAVDAKILDIKSSKIKAPGIIFVSFEKPNSSQDLVVVQSGNKVSLLPYGMRATKDKVLGTVVAWEQRFR